MEEVLVSHTRRYDCVTAGREGRFLVLAPECEPTSAALIAERVGGALSRLGLEVRFGYACFPSSARGLGDLIRLSEPTTRVSIDGALDDELGVEEWQGDPWRLPRRGEDLGARTRRNGSNGPAEIDQPEIDQPEIGESEIEPGVAEPGSSRIGRSALERAGWLLRHHRHGRRPGRRYHLAKRGLDVAIVVAAGPVWAPLLLMAMVVVKLDDPSASVFFRQARTGQDGHRIGVLKLRTMVPDADAMKESLAALNERQGPDFKISNDPRITGPGRLLRKTSLDELPQLLNILRGDMSLVGPRPHSLDPDTYDEWHRQRFGAAPGLTGLWQISARESESFDERVRLDIAYIERRSLGLDLSILMRTIPAILGQRGSW